MHKDVAPESIWYQFYQEQHPPDKLGVDFSPQNTPPTLNSNYFLYQCIFHGFTNGCIHLETAFEDEPRKLLFSTCYFYNNTKTGAGSCLYIINNFQVVQHQFCAYSCKIKFEDSTYRGHYCCIGLRDISDFMNYIKEGSISHCGNIDQESPHNYDHLVELGMGSIEISKSNISKSSSKAHAGYCIFSSASSADKYSNIDLTNVESNIAELSIIGYAYSGYYQQKLCNFINNTVTLDIGYTNYLIGTSVDELKIFCCCFVNNIYNIEKVALIENSKQNSPAIITDCFIDKLITKGQFNSNNIITESSTLILKFFETGYCFIPKQKCEEKTCIYRFSHYEKYLIDISLSIIINRSN